MKRGLISWDQTQLPSAAFAVRIEAIQRRMAEYDVPAAVVYSDVWRSNDARYLSNYMPYWNRAFIVVPRREKPMLLCSLSPRVYPWIKSVTIHERIVPSPSLPAQLAKVSAEQGWRVVGVVDLAGLPFDLHSQLAAESLRLVDIPRSALRSGVTGGEIAMHRRAAILARRILDEQIGKRAVGLTDQELAGRLELEFRRAGVEDLIVLICDGRGPPRPAAGHPVGESSSVMVALECNGHWAKLSRNVAGLSSPLPPAPGSTVYQESLSGPYPWEGLTELGRGENAIVSLQVELQTGGNRLYYGDTCLSDRNGMTLL